VVADRLNAERPASLAYEADALVDCPDNVQAETCDLCDGDGQVQAGVAARYEAEQALDEG
jgi:hypothetical protein